MAQKQRKPGPSKCPKIMDPMLPMLSIFEYWSITLGILEVQEHMSARSPKFKPLER